VLAFTFPGQGSLRPGVGRPWIDHPSWEVVQEASRLSGRNIPNLLCDATQDDLTLTRNVQLATFALSLVVLDAIERLGLGPSICAGHSLGEYTAVVGAGAVSFEDGVRLVAERGEAMQDAADARPGTMVALIGISDDDAEIACQRAEAEAWVANYNAPGQVVVAGTQDGVEATVAMARELGARKVVPLTVAGAFHTPLLLPARQRLRKALAGTRFADPEVPIVANVDARAHAAGHEWPPLLSAQLCSPVRWHQSLRTMASLDPEAIFVEVGAGGVLTGLVRRVLPSARAIGVATPDDLDKLVEALAGAGPVQANAAIHQGEHLYVSERVVVSPAAGVFEPTAALAALGLDAAPFASGDRPVAVGELIGEVGGEAVRSAFAGSLVGLLAHTGERVTRGQPLAWLRTGTGGGA
jgi:[acyl-carrier-protein] S-malonyltransferase